MAKSALHAVVENQAALGNELPVRRAIAHLMSEGLDRHKAMHAVASILAEDVHGILRRDAAVDAAADNAAAEQLTVETLRHRTHHSRTARTGEFLLCSEFAVNSENVMRERATL